MHLVNILVTVYVSCSNTNSKILFEMQISIRKWAYLKGPLSKYKPRAYFWNFMVSNKRLVIRKAISFLKIEIVHGLKIVRLFVSENWGLFLGGLSFHRVVLILSEFLG